MPDPGSNDSAPLWRLQQLERDIEDIKKSRSQESRDIRDELRAGLTSIQSTLLTLQTQMQAIQLGYVTKAEFIERSRVQDAEQRRQDDAVSKFFFWLIGAFFGLIITMGMEIVRLVAPHTGS